MSRFATTPRVPRWHAALALASGALLTAACADRGDTTAPLDPGRTPGTAGVATPPADTGGAPTGTPSTAASFPITGTVGIALLDQAPADSSGGFTPMRGLPGVTITVHAFAADSTTATLRQVAEVTSGAGGVFATPALPAGHYRVTARPPGAAQSIGHVLVTIGTSAPAPLRYYVGGDRPGTTPPRDSTQGRPPRDSTQGRPPRDSVTTPPDTTPRPLRGYVASSYAGAADSAAAVSARVANVALVLYAITPGDSLAGRAEVLTEVARTTSGADGSFATAPVRPGTYRLIATPPQGSAYRQTNRWLFVPPGGLPIFPLLLERR